MYFRPQYVVYKNLNYFSFYIVCFLKKQKNIYCIVYILWVFKYQVKRNVFHIKVDVILKLKQKEKSKTTKKTV